MSTAAVTRPRPQVLREIRALVELAPAAAEQQKWRKWRRSHHKVGTVAVQEDMRAWPKETRSAFAPILAAEHIGQLPHFLDRGELAAGLRRARAARDLEREYSDAGVYTRLCEAVEAAVLPLLGGEPPKAPALGLVSPVAVEIAGAGLVEPGPKPAPERPCKGCGALFEAKNNSARYCSPECRETAREKNRPAPKPAAPPRPCVYSECSKSVTSPNPRARYCSAFCAVRDWQKKNRPRVIIPPRACKQCEKTFSPEHNKALYCSRSCFAKYHYRLKHPPRPGVSTPAKLDAPKPERPLVPAEPARRRPSFRATVCEHCRTAFQPRNKRGLIPRYCSFDCRNRAEALLRKPDPELYPCATCGAMLDLQKARHNARYCSQSCKHRHLRESRENRQEEERGVRPNGAPPGEESAFYALLEED